MPSAAQVVNKRFFCWRMKTDQERNAPVPFHRWGVEVLNETCPASYKDFVAELKTKPRFQVTVLRNETADFS